MIRINLLPEEFRKKARTPIKLVLALGGAVVVNAGLVVWWAFQAFGIQAQIESEKESLQTEMDGLSPQVTYYSSLDSEAKAYKSRESTLQNITSSRISWTKKLDELIDVVNRGGNGQRHMVWFDDLTVAQATDARSKTAGTFKANGHSGSDKFAQVANFLEDVESSTFVSDFLPPSPPEGSQAQEDDSLVPSVAWSFPLALLLKSPEERLGKKTTDKGKPGKAGAKQPAPAPAPADTSKAAESGEAKK
jgi:Tfp pilus assembly protein PilN